MKPKVLALIILYHPESSAAVKDRVDALFANGVDHIFLYDNSQPPFDLDFAFSYSGKLSVYHFNQNNGISDAVNFSLRLAKESDFNFLWLFDQDSYVYDKNMLSCLIDDFISYDNSTTSCTALIAPLIYDTISNRFKKPLSLNLKLISNIPTAVFEVGQAISSGMLINLDLPLCDLLHDSCLFIDWVDIEFCHRLVKNDYTLLVSPRSVLNHSLGNINISFFGVTFPLRNPIRHYYMIRNAIYLVLYSSSIKISAKIIFSFTILKYLSVAFFSPRARNIYAIVLAINHGFFCRMGRLNQKL